MVTKRKTKPASKKANPASILAQKTWQGFPVSLKRNLEGMLPDSDRDGVPNGFDCRPYDPRRQEEFLPRDAEFLRNNPKIRLGKSLGKGCVGEVRTVRGNPNLVVKTVRSYEGATDVVDSIKDGKFGKRELKKESDDFIKYKLEKEPLFIPTKAIKIGSEKKLALVRPKVTIITEYYPNYRVMHKELIHEAQLKQMRKNLIDLSYKGYVFVDGLQLGVDETGRILMYDFGFIERDKPGSDRAFQVNDTHWSDFINEFPGGKAKYGAITKRKDMGQRKPIGERKSTMHQKAV